MVLIRESGFAPDDLQLVGIFCRWLSLSSVHQATMALGCRPVWFRRGVRST